MSKTTKAANTNGNGTPAADSGNTSTALALDTHDDLAGLGLDDVLAGEDGLGQVDADDIKIPVYVLNMKGKGADGRALQPDEYYNTIDERQKRTVNAAFLHLHKSNLYSRWNQAEQRTDVMCKSFDRVTGIFVAENNRERPCKGCPDAEWRRNAEGKRTRNCSPVYNMFAVDRDEGLPFVVRFKRTSLEVIKAYLRKHHIGRRVIKGQRLNYPLQTYGVTLTAEMSDGKSPYAIPILTRGPVLSAQEVASLTENAKTLRDSVLPILNHADAATEREGGAEPDTSFDPSKFAQDEGKDFAGGDAA